MTEEEEERRQLITTIVAVALIVVAAVLGLVYVQNSNARDNERRDRDVTEMRCALYGGDDCEDDE